MLGVVIQSPAPTPRNATIGVSLALAIYSLFAGMTLLPSSMAAAFAFFEGTNSSWEAFLAIVPLLPVAIYAAIAWIASAKGFTYWLFSLWLIALVLFSTYPSFMLLAALIWWYVHRNEHSTDA